jgi:hypothetical protein
MSIPWGDHVVTFLGDTTAGRDQRADKSRKQQTRADKSRQQQTTEGAENRGQRPDD